MRTTIDLPDQVFRELKALAAMKGISLKEVFQTAIEHELASANKADVVRDRVQLPLLKSKNPGTLNLTNADIEDLLT
jgi:hypothetical protein